MQGWPSGQLFCAQQVVFLKTFHHAFFCSNIAVGYLGRCYFVSGCISINYKSMYPQVP